MSPPPELSNERKHPLMSLKYEPQVEKDKSYYMDQRLKKVPSFLRLWPELGQKSEGEQFIRHQTLVDQGHEHEREPFDDTYAWKRCFERDYANDFIRTKPSLIKRKAAKGKKAAAK